MDGEEYDPRGLVAPDGRGNTGMVESDRAYHEHPGNIVDPNHGGLEPVVEQHRKQVPVEKQNPGHRYQVGKNQGNQRIPCQLHAKGSGAFGTFTVTNDVTRYTKAKIFSAVGKKTDMFIRFSTVAGERGAADAERDIRGFAMKFYTEEGNWDLVGNNTPVFFLRDPLKFPDLNHAVKRDPRTNMRSAKNNWDFWTSLPEALHQVTIVMSDRGIPYSYRHMHGFGSHTFSLINAKNERFWVKFHLKTQQGIKNLTDQEAEAIIGKDRESHQRDLYESIEKGDYPRWTMYFQIMPEKDAAKMPYNPFDLTKVWYHKDYPLIEVGVVELNRNPENYFADVEQAAFNPANIVPGIGFSPIRCSRAGFSPTAMLSVTGWESIIT